MSLEADRVKLQLLGVYTWESIDSQQPRWCACYGAHTPQDLWLFYKDGKPRHPYNPESNDARIMARTEAEVIRLVLKELKLHGCITTEG